MNLLSKVPLKKLLILIIVTVLVFFVIFRTTVDAKSFLETAKSANIKFLWYALIAILPTFILSPLRWFYVLKAYDYNPKFKSIFYAVNAANTFILIPGRLGDFVKSYFTKDTVPVAESVGSVIVEKIIDVVVLLLIATVGLFILKQPIYALCALVVACALPIGIIFIKKIGLRFGLDKIGLVKKVADAVRIPNHPKYIIASGIASTANWMNSVISTYFLFLAFQTITPLSAVVAYLPLTLFIGLIPITIAGIGVRDSAILALFSKYATSTQSLAVGICYSFLGYFLFMLVGIPLVIKHFHSKNST